MQRKATQLRAAEQAAHPPTPASGGQGARIVNGIKLTGNESAGLSLNPGEHCLIGGMTGCGKTTFARPLTQHFQRQLPGSPALYIESKIGEFDDIPGLHIRRQEPPTLDELFESSERGAGLAVIWTPEHDNEKDYDALFERVLKAHRPIVIVVDELSSLGGKNGQSFPINFARVLKQGRSLKITLIVLTQELAYIPRQVLRQTMHVFMMMFDPSDPEDFDRLRSQKLTGLPAINQRFAFNYRSRLEPWKAWTYPGGFKQFFGMARPPRRKQSNKRGK